MKHQENIGEEEEVMQKVMIQKVVTAVWVCWLLLLGSASADHLKWMQPYTTATGASCCYDIDCMPAQVTAGPGGQVIVNDTPIQMAPGSVHPSQTPDIGWYCYERHKPGCKEPEIEISSRCARCAFFQQHPGMF